MIEIKTTFTGPLSSDRWQTMFNETMKRAMNLSVNVVEGEVAKQAKDKGLVGVTKELIQGIQGQIVTSIYGTVGIVGPAAVYGEVMELGRRKGSRTPPSDALERWVYLKLGIPKKDAPGIAFVIARSISKKGIKGRHFFRDAEKPAKPKVIKIFNDAIKQIENKLSD